MNTLIQQLLSIASISPNDLGCQDVLKTHLMHIGFECTDMPFGNIDNLWACYGNSGPTLIFAGHTDVVPPGPIEDWKFDPFKPTVHDNLLYARGTADMKVALCCMVTACEQFIKKYPNFPGRIAFLVTGCEEITTDNGTKKVIETLKNQGESLDWCIVGEASSVNHIGDQVKVGRRGSLSGELTIQGKQGHIAYPHSASNPIHLCLKAIDELTSTEWDSGDEYFDPTSFQISNFNAGTGANNVIPGSLTVLFNFRYSAQSTKEQLMQRVHAILDRHNLNYQLDWCASGEPFLTDKGKLLDSTIKAIELVTHTRPALDTGGGTSDARFIAPLGIETLELGFCNQTIHKVNEHIQVDHIKQLESLYFNTLEQLFITPC